MQHLVLARQYRPILFSEVIGQDIFVTLLKNALAQHRVGHAFLLTGIRGVGKTTIARLIAKAVTCAQRTEDQEPCNQCASCTAVLQDKHMDIVEMDAASHTGVDDIRQILEGSHYKPIISTHKIYIIDEVHMLSKSAFNALLKLLEEPPSHVKFILATTEQSKIPATVVSRCQQIHLRRLTPQALGQLLKTVCHKEGFQVDDQALDALCQYSEGSARDALSLLEKTLVSVGTRRIIERSDIDTTLGLIPKHEMDAFVDAIESHHIDTALEKARQFYHQGVEPTSIVRQILSILYQRTTNAKKDLHRLGGLDRLWQIAQKGLEEIATSPFPFLSLEMILMRLSYVGTFPTPGQLLDIIENAPEMDAHPVPVSESSSPSDHGPQGSMPESAPESSSTLHTLDPHSDAGQFFADLQTHLMEKREAVLLAHIQHSVSFVDWNAEMGHLCLHWTESTPFPHSMTQELEHILGQWQNKPCRVTWSDTGHYASQAEHDAQVQSQTLDKVAQHPKIIALKEIFPNLSIQSVAESNDSADA
jgi:DNA polymerase-3 subunit gamma/tau